MPSVVLKRKVASLLHEMPSSLSTVLSGTLADINSVEIGSVAN